MKRLLGTAALLSVFSACSSDPATPAGGGATSGTAGMGTSGAAGTSSVGGSGGTAGKASVGGSAGVGGAGAAGGVGGGSGGAGRGGSAGTSGGSAGMVGGGAGTPPAVGGAGGAGGASGGSAGAGAGGSAGAPGGMGGLGGDAGSGAGVSGKGGWQCPTGVTGVPTLSGSPTRIMSVPPPDDFNMNNQTFGNVEGPVWIGDSLYLSEMSSTPYGGTGTKDTEIKKSRILKVSASGQTSIFVADSGSNGLAVDADGNIVAAVHKDGSVDRFAVPGGTETAIATMFMGARFNSPNDLVIHSNGTIYFSDPTYNGPATPPQSAMRVYRIPPGGQPQPIPSSSSPDTFTNPNGVTLSLAEDFLYVAASTGRRYPVMSDGTLGAGQDFAAVTAGDGLAVDCAGNLYVAVTNSQNVKVYKPDGTSIGMLTVADIQSVTNVAFGGSDHKTLYITGLGNNKGLFSINLSIPGRPY
jgi:gluconolactonase